MDENNNPEIINDENPDEISNIVVLTDQDGNDIEFEFLDIVELDDKQYVVLLPVDKADEGEVVIFRIEGDEEDESYVGVETEEEAARVFEEFKKNAKDDFNFVD